MWCTDQMVTRQRPSYDWYSISIFPAECGTSPPHISVHTVPFYRHFFSPSMRKSHFLLSILPQLATFLPILSWFIPFCHSYRCSSTKVLFGSLFGGRGDRGDRG
jgi:hypothetical protein